MSGISWQALQQKAREVLHAAMTEPADAKPEAVRIALDVMKLRQEKDEPK